MLNGRDLAKLKAAAERSASPAAVARTAESLLGTTFGRQGAEPGAALGRPAPSMLRDFGVLYQELIGLGHSPDLTAKTAAVETIPFEARERFGLGEVLGRRRQVYRPRLQRLGRISSLSLAA